MSGIDHAALEAVLTAETAALRTLCAALVEQKAALLDQGPYSLLAAVSTVEGQARRLQALEEERGALAVRSGRGATWAALCADSPEPYRARLALLRADAQGLVAQIGAINADIRELAATGVSFADRYLSTLRPALRQTYPPPGGRPAGAGGSLLNSGA